MRSVGRTLLAVASAWTLSASPLAGQQPDGVAVLEGASAHYEGVMSLCADFVQQLEVTLLGTETTGVGRMCQARPDRFAMRFSDPEGDMVVVDGESIWLYYPSNDEKVVFRLRVSASLGVYDLHRDFLERPAEKYDIVYEASEEVAGHPAHRLRLTPKQPSSYRSAVLWIDAGQVLRQIRIFEENETVRTITFAGVRLDPTDLDPAFFSFTVPEGADVISR